MSSLQQYLDLYAAQGETLCGASCAAMNAAREAALAGLQQHGLPTSRNERYKYTDVEAALAPDYGLNLRRTLPAVDPYKEYRCAVPHLSTSLYFVVNDVPYTVQTPTAPLPEGVLVQPLSQADPALVAVYYNREAGRKYDGVTALNTLLAQDGLLVYLPAGTILSNPIQIVNVAAARADLMVNRRLLLVGSLEVFGYGELAVLNVLLVEEAGLLEELLHTAVGDVLNHSLGEVVGLLFSHALLEGADFVSLLSGDVALHDAFFEVLFAFGDVEVEASLLESSLNGLLHLLFLGLFDSDLEFLFLNLLGYALLVEGNGVHSGHLHSHVVGCFLSGEVGLYHGAELVAVHVVVNGNVVAFDEGVTIELHLLARDTAACNDCISDGVAVHGECAYLFKALALVSHSSVEDFLSELHEVSVLSNEVGFALEGDDSAEAFTSLAEYATLSSVAVGALGGYCLTTLTDEFDSGFDIAFGLGEGLLAIAKTCASHAAQLLDIFH